jgi:hypothetical protein
MSTLAQTTSRLDAGAPFCQITLRRSSIHAPGRSATHVSNAAHATTKFPASASSSCPAVSTGTTSNVRIAVFNRPKLELAEFGRVHLISENTCQTNIGSYLKENDGMYLWLQLPGSDEPRYYKLPWDEKAAKALQGAIGENERQHGSGVGMGLTFERGWDREDPKFYALPQPKLPDKPGERPPVTVYRAPGQGI